MDNEQGLALFEANVKQEVEETLILDKILNLSQKALVKWKAVDSADRVKMGSGLSTAKLAKVLKGAKIDQSKKWWLWLMWLMPTQ
ncbi:hypothetical protein C0991_000642 [Blastosporella zonata]|nr:hypothetical protein C0991_000642 [Blastosporella zonata]